MAACETVKIQTENGEVLINKSDFNPKEHKLAGDKPKLVKSDKKKTK